jgi:hypothetical protein
LFNCESTVIIIVANDYFTLLPFRPFLFSSLFEKKCRHRAFNIVVIHFSSHLLERFTEYSLFSKKHSVISKIRRFAVSTFGSFDDWQFLRLAVSTFGSFDVWQFRRLAVSTFGSFDESQSQRCSGSIATSAAFRFELFNVIWVRNWFCKNC